MFSSPPALVLDPTHLVSKISTLFKVGLHSKKLLKFGLIEKTNAYSQILKAHKFIINKNMSNN